MPVTENILKLADPENYACQVWRYRVSLQTLVLRLNEKSKPLEESFYLAFESAMYFEGPTSWTGANLCVGRREECLQLLHKLGLGIAPDDYLLDRYCLYGFPSSQFEIKILSSFHFGRLSHAEYEAIKNREGL